MNMINAVPWGLFAGCVLSFIVLNWDVRITHSDPYNMSLVCSNGIKTTVVAHQSRITISNTVYLIEQKDHRMTYEKDAFSMCITILDEDVVAAPPRSVPPVVAKPL